MLAVHLRFSSQGERRFGERRLGQDVVAHTFSVDTTK